MKIKQIILTMLIATISMSFGETKEETKWMTNYEEALIIAKKDSKTILMNFSGSDWCANCIRLEKSVFSTIQFQEYAKDNLILLRLDFPVKKKNKLSPELTKQNEDLAEIYNKKGAFPTVVLLDPDKKVLGETGYKSLSAEKYIDHINSLLK